MNVMYNSGAAKTAIVAGGRQEAAIQHARERLGHHQLEVSLPGRDRGVSLPIASRLRRRRDPTARRP
jgi:hypothetical protein